jgi:hypothetical protein
MVSFKASLARVISPHDPFDRSQEALEAMLTESSKLHFRLAHDRSRAGCIVEQRKLAKVVTLIVSLHRQVYAALEDLCLSGLENVKGLADVAFLDDGGARRVLLRFESVCNLGALVRRQTRKKRNLLEESFVKAAALEGAVHENAAEGHAIKRPEGRGLARHDRGSTGSVVHESELTERASGADGAHLVAEAVCARFQLARRVDVDVERALLDNIEVVAHVALLDDLYALGRYWLLVQRAQDLRGLVVVEMREEEVARDGRLEARQLVGCLLVEGWGEVLVVGRGGVERLGGDGGAAVGVVVAGKVLAVARDGRHLRDLVLGRAAEAAKVAKAAAARVVTARLAEVDVRKRRGGGRRHRVVLLFFFEALHRALRKASAAGRGAEGVVAGEAALRTALGAGMLLRQQGLGALRLEAAVEEVGAELQDVLGLVLEDFAVEGSYLIGVVGRQGHWEGGGEGSMELFDVGFASGAGMAAMDCEGPERSVSVQRGRAAGAIGMGCNCACTETACAGSMLGGAWADDGARRGEAAAQARSRVGRMRAASSRATAGAGL